MANITKRKFEAFKLLLDNRSYSETATVMGISSPRVRQLCESVARFLSKNDPYMRIVFGYGCFVGIKNNHGAVSEAFDRLTKKMEF